MYRWILLSVVVCFSDEMKVRRRSDEGLFDSNLEGLL